MAHLTVRRDDLGVFQKNIPTVGRCSIKAATVAGAFPRKSIDTAAVSHGMALATCWRDAVGMELFHSLFV